MSTIDSIRSGRCVAMDQQERRAVAGFPAVQSDPVDIEVVLPHHRFSW